MSGAEGLLDQTCVLRDELNEAHGGSGSGITHGQFHQQHLLLRHP